MRAYRLNDGEERLQEFLRGFARGSGCDREEANELWAAWSRMLSDSQAREIEVGGEPAGERQGRRYRALYPDQDED